MTEKAENDLAEIWTYIAEDSPNNATAFINQITERFEPLLQHPEIGPSRDELAPGLRVHFHKNYAIYYTASDEDLIIVHVVHGSRDAVALFAESGADH
ncbi:type II toxin-antitoxin system RelE/ParE family toxin [Ruegeria sp. EL01]|uniref:type II toxin-antitoxin system RelE/ParE family toxin n=1 Tax=Ruegeria sp. EL01 TaxID=2107578 RepID=UPI000EA8297C|nr:type II toxin-antitoxin system RelE/ParE family toxin [Ruegeria sp. EL01]